MFPGPPLFCFRVRKTEDKDGRGLGTRLGQELVVPLVPLSDESCAGQLSGKLQVVLDLGSSSQCESLNVITFKLSH